MTRLDILIKPIITEKSLEEANRGKYTFEVSKEASKGEVKEAVEKMFDVKVMSVKTVSLKGGKRRVGKKRLEVKEKDRKKALVEVQKDQKIGLFEVGAK
jgi:large subunit ribosomal protein L23